MSEKPHSEEQYILICKNLIEKQLGWNEPEKWRHSDYEKLSILIFTKTGTKVSHITLKRLWGKIDFKGIPHITTLNALSAFLGYKDWMDFKTQISISGEVLPPTHIISKKRNKKRLFFIITTLIILIIAIHIYLKSTNNKPIVEQIIERDDYTFICEHPVGYIPHTVTFKYDVSQINSDEIYIQPDKAVMLKLDKNKNLINYLYYSPGYFKVNFIVNGKIIESANTHILTKNWLVSFYNSGDEMKPVLIKEGIIHNGILQLPTNHPMFENLMKKYDYWVNYFDSRNFAFKADQFFFETRIRNESPFELSCSDFQISLIGNNGLFEFRFVNPGCSKNILLYVHNKAYDGMHLNLSAFEIDLKKWHTINFMVKGDSGNIYVDNKFIYNLNIYRPMDSLKCIRFKTKGCGAIDYVKILDRYNDQVYFEDFE